MTILFKRIVLILTSMCALICYSQLIFASTNSRSMLFDSNQTHIYSANFDTGSVSVIDAETGQIIIEKTIGRDIRRLALSNGKEPKLLVSDYLNAELVLLDAQTLSVDKRIKVPSKPFGVIYDSQSELFYAVSFEQARLLVLDKHGTILHSIATQETPRGLALTDDRRLLITHAMTGQVSIFDVHNALPELLKIIQLEDSEANEELTVSQGKPRLLDSIAISPDGESAWLPHVLWSFGHDFQFQSTVFPAVSILDLSLGNEQEILDERKQLFKQINITESGNKTRIISNPHEAVFTKGGDKVIVSLAGSEDLMVFDLSRQGTSNSKRHRRTKFQGGVKATQIFRNIPGDNPKGLLLKDRTLYVQNAMSLDITTFNIGQPGPFARVTLGQESFAKLVNHDPLSPALRLGKTLFNRANTGDKPEAPMAGDFWMSCNSCHFDGFNFTNKFLLKDGQKDKFQNAVTGHVDTFKMIAGDPVRAYIDIIQKTQGGMDNIDLKEPPIEVAKMMSALNTYVKTPENLPYLSTWLRLEQPERYTHPEEWVSSAKCADCHSTIYDQWADSSHGMNMDHPFYRFQEDLAAREEGEDFRVLCRGCHAPQMVFNNDQGSLEGFGDLYEKNSQSLIDAHEQKKAVSERGTGCLFCHRITKAENAGGNADLSVNLKDRQMYIFEDTRNDILQWLADAQINASPLEHKKSYVNADLYQSSLYCATCHNEFTPGMGANINDNFGEWLASPFNRPDDHSQHKTCIDCHMTQGVKDFDHKVAGQSTDNGPIKENMRSHHFTGGNYYFTGMRNPEHKQMSIDILKNAVSLEIQKQGSKLQALVTNHNVGHDMPGGSRRQVWLEVIVKDKHSNIVYESGVMKEGVIPKDTRKFIKVGVDKEGNDVGARFWRYVKIGQDTRIKSGETRTEVFDLPEDIDYPISISTRVLYQVFSKSTVEEVQKAFPDQKIPFPEVVEMAKVEKAYMD